MYKLLQMWGHQDLQKLARQQRRVTYLCFQALCNSTTDLKVQENGVAKLLWKEQVIVFAFSKFSSICLWENPKLDFIIALKPVG